MESVNSDPSSPSGIERRRSVELPPLQDERFPALSSLERKTGVKKRHLAIGGLALMAGVVFFGAGVRFLADFIAVIYPTIQTFKVVKAPTTKGMNDMLTYWLVWGLFSTTESLSDRLLSWVPIYYFLKFILLAWCLLPGSQGSAVIYKYALRPVFRRHHHRIDSTLHSTHRHMTKTLDRMFYRRLRNSRDFGSRFRDFSGSSRDTSQTSRPSSRGVDYKGDRDAGISEPARGLARVPREARGSVGSGSALSEVTCQTPSGEQLKQRRSYS
ncbi:hypothetical protein AAMO2058_000627200 [Amorphochlora amoebiformis]